MKQGSVLDIKGYDERNPYVIKDINNLAAAEEQIVYQTIPQIEKAIKQVKKQMELAAKDLDFIEAAKQRDEMFRLQKELEEMKG